jgi:hypothetical protein
LTARVAPTCAGRTAAASSQAGRCSFSLAFFPPIRYRQLGMAQETGPEAPDRYNGRRFRPKELALIREVVDSCSGLSRKELAQTLCELLGWKRSSGRLKALECGEFLSGWKPPGPCAAAEAAAMPGRIAHERACDHAGRPRTGSGRRVGDFAPIEIEAVTLISGCSRAGGAASLPGAQGPWRALALPAVRVPAGADGGGCIQLSSAAWRMAVRDTWIGWDDATRRRKLPQVVNNSRFLILPWVHVKNPRAACCHSRCGGWRRTGPGDGRGLPGDARHRPL